MHTPGQPVLPLRRGRSQEVPRLPWGSTSGRTSHGLVAAATRRTAFRAGSVRKHLVRGAERKALEPWPPGTPGTIPNGGRGSVPSLPTGPRLPMVAGFGRSRKEPFLAAGLADALRGSPAGKGAGLRSIAHSWAVPPREEVGQAAPLAPEGWRKRRASPDCRFPAHPPRWCGSVREFRTYPARPGPRHVPSLFRGVAARGARPAGRGPPLHHTKFHLRMNHKGSRLFSVV